MIGTTLRDIRERITELASETGEYYLVCARYGDPPVPSSGLRFESRETARVAARMTERYRAALRRYDPRLPYYDVVVCQERPVGSGAGSRSGEHSRCRDAGATEWTLTDPIVTRTNRSDRTLVEFCHRVAATVFETLSARGHEAVESAVMDAYFEFAERCSSPDGLCLRLLECMAAEIATGLPPVDQARVLSAAADRLDADGDGFRTAGQTPVDGALSRLRALGIIERYRNRRTEDSGTAVRQVELTEYALARHADRLPLLPVVVELHRRGREWIPVSAAPIDRERGWSVEFAPVEEAIRSDARACSVAPEVS
jgi:hypothetical protein